MPPANKPRGGPKGTGQDVSANASVSRDIAARSSLQHLGSEDAMYSLTGEDDDIVSDREMHAATEEAMTPIPAQVGGKFTFTPAIESSPSVQRDTTDTTAIPTTENPQPRRPRDPIQFPMRPSIFNDDRQPADTTNTGYRPPTTTGDRHHAVDLASHWEEDGIQVARSPRYSLKPFKKEITTIMFLLIVGVVCFCVGLPRLLDGHAGGLILLIIGMITLIPGAYFGFAFVRAYQNGSPFTALEFN